MSTVSPQYEGNWDKTPVLPVKITWVSEAKHDSGAMKEVHVV